MVKPMSAKKEQSEMLERWLPHGLIASKKWLLEQGFSRHTLDNYVKSGQLVAVTSGVYSKANVLLTWQGVVCSLQRMMAVPVLVGGATALELLGVGHYLSVSGNKTVHLYSQAKAPSWLNRLPLAVEFIWHSSMGWGAESAAHEQQVVTHLWREDLPALLLSATERAYLELLAEVPDKVSFEHADEIMQGLTSLSPRRLQWLLEYCQSVKVKRLFFWLAERHGYGWFNKLNPERVNFGAGKRMLCKGGRLDAKYQITVPAHLHG